MTWKSEIFRAFFVALGASETISNCIYLLKGNGMRLAAKQHQEIPPDLKENQLRVKVICMLVSGILFLTVGLYSYLTHSFPYPGAIAVMSAFTLYAVTEAAYYKYWRTICFSCLSILLLALLLLSR